MRDEDHKIYVIMFFNSAQDSPSRIERMRKIVLDERQKIKENILAVYTDVMYAEVDLAGGKHDEVAHEIGIEIEDTFEYPTVVAVQDGVGKWIHGPNSYQLLASVIDALLGRE